MNIVRGNFLRGLSFSAERLRLWLVEHPGVVVHLAFPGIGLGGLSPEAVWGVLEATLAEVSGAVRLYRK